MALLRRLTAARSRREPAVPVFEDLPWVELESEASSTGDVRSLRPRQSIDRQILQRVWWTAAVVRRGEHRSAPAPGASRERQHAYLREAPEMLEFLIGKQLPYVGLAMLNYASMVVVALVVFRVPITGSLPVMTGAALLFLYALAFSFAYTSLGAGTGALILFASVQFAMIAAGLHCGERPFFAEWLGWALAAGGLVYLVMPGIAAPPQSEGP